MIQNRTNPLEKKQMKPKTTAKTTTVKDVKTAEPEQLMPIQKRVNPLTLEQVKAPVEKKVVPTKEKKVQIAVTEVKKPEPEKIYIPTEIVGKAKKSFDSIFSILDTKTLIDPSDEANINKHSAENLTGKIEFKNVSFAYPTKPDQKVLKNVSFTIEPG